jgi:hypothetical protein
MSDPVAPAVHTRPPEAVQADAAAEKTEFDSRPVSNTDKKRMLVQQIKALEALEAREKLGARRLTPKQQLMDFTALEDKHPDKHFRWVNTSVATKAHQRQQEGYVAVDDSMAEGTGVEIRLGSEFTLMHIPKSKAQARVTAQDRLNSERLGANGNEMREVAERVAHDLSKRGLNVPVERIFIQMR